ncbi:MAG: alanine:cation symporter family protein, partial [Anaerococcus sp.]|nr:alanine:cation symporter family protein [Anaerococcus sp.]
EANIIHIFKDKYKIPLWIYRLFAALMFIISTKMSLEIVWGLIDVFVGILVFINVITLIFLFKSVKIVLDDYEEQKQKGKKPVWNKEDNDLYLDEGEYKNFKI